MDSVIVIVSSGILTVLEKKTVCSCHMLNLLTTLIGFVAKDPMLLHADSEDSDQTGRTPRLI